MKEIFLTTAVALLLFSCKNKTTSISPVEEKITESVYASGVIKSKNQYQVFSSVNALIKEVLVTEGDVVKKGDALFRLSDATAKLNTENAQIAADYATIPANADKLNALKVDIDVAKSKMDNDASLLQKQRNLWEQGIGTRNELDQRELAYKNSSNAFSAAKFRYNDMLQQLVAVMLL